MTAPRVFSYVQYLQGVGHLYRAAHIADAMAQTGLDVHLVSGGTPVSTISPENVTLHQLPPIRCRDGDFSDLVDADGEPLDDAYRDRRRDVLLELFQRLQPQALIVEAFPFGRRQMRFELLPLLEAARSVSPRPLIVCSVRDILQASSKPARARETAELVNQSYDHVLVHGDPAFARLDDTFPGAAEIEAKIRYTGLVGDFSKSVPVSSGSTDGEVLVSAGGGATQSEILLSIAMQARGLSQANDRPWRLLAGPNLPKDEFNNLQSQSPDGVILESNRRDFPSLLAKCAVSVSQAGYNTVVDLLRCGCRAVVAPYSAHGETEQLHRARRLKNLGLAHVVEAARLSPVTLAGAIDAALAAPPPQKSGINVSGAETSAKLVSKWVSQ